MHAACMLYQCYNRIHKNFSGNLYVFIWILYNALLQCIYMYILTMHMCVCTSTAIHCGYVMSHTIKIGTTYHFFLQKQYVYVGDDIMKNILIGKFLSIINAALYIYIILLLLYIVYIRIICTGFSK